MNDETINLRLREINATLERALDERRSPGDRRARWDPTTLATDDLVYVLGAVRRRLRHEQRNLKKLIAKFGVQPPDHPTCFAVRRGLRLLDLFRTLDKQMRKPRPQEGRQLEGLK